MKPHILLVYLFCLMPLLFGCDQQKMLEKFIPQEESAIAQQIISQLTEKDYDSINKQLDPELKDKFNQKLLDQISALLPTDKPKNIVIIGSNTSKFNNQSTYNLTYEYEYIDKWLLANVVLKKKDNNISIIGLHFTPLKQSLKETNKFTFKDKSLIHYLVFALAVTIPIFIIYSFMICIKTPIQKRKWLWLLFIAVGIVQFSFNWTDGSYMIQPISFLLFGSGFFYAAPYAPVIFKIAFPLGAIMFLFKRQSIITKNMS